MQRVRSGFLLNYKPCRTRKFCTHTHNNTTPPRSRHDNIQCYAVSKRQQRGWLGIRTYCTRARAFRVNYYTVVERTHKNVMWPIRIFSFSSFFFFFFYRLERGSNRKTITVASSLCARIIKNMRVHTWLRHGRNRGRAHCVIFRGYTYTTRRIESRSSVLKTYKYTLCYVLGIFALGRVSCGYNLYTYNNVYV